MLLNKNREFVKKPSKHVLSEYIVPLNCNYINFKIKDIPFPKNAIVVSVIRNGKYVIANENFNIQYADQIHILTDVNDYPYVRKEIEDLFDGK